MNETVMGSSMKTPNRPETLTHIEEVLNVAEDVKAHVSQVVYSFVPPEPEVKEDTNKPDKYTHTMLDRINRCLQDIRDMINKL